MVQILESARKGVRLTLAPEGGAPPRPDTARAWRKRMHATLRAMLEAYTGKLALWLASGEDASERDPTEAERYAKTFIALTRCFDELDAARVPRAKRIASHSEAGGDKQDKDDLDTLLATLECRLDQLAAAPAAKGVPREPE